MICDFCSSPFPAWRYPAATFEDLIGSRSIEDWLACDDCHSLIEAGDRMGLGLRSLTAPGLQIAIAFLGREDAPVYCRDLHDRFWNARRGPAVQDG